MEPLGTKLRRQRRRLGLTLDELAGRTGISKPYLSLIETGRVPNPPSDEKLRRLEQTLGFTAGELLTQAHIQRTPKDVRVMLSKLLIQRNGMSKAEDGAADALTGTLSAVRTGGKHGSAHPGQPPALHASSSTATADKASSTIDLDDIYLSGVLHELVEKNGGNVEAVRMNAVPVVNKVSAGYPRDFTDLSYPPRVADDYVGCPDVQDKDAFAARVHGDSMHPKYRAGDIVIFSPAASPKNGDDCFVRFDDGQTTFKRVFFESDESAGTSVLRLQPRNEKYPPRIVPSESVSGLYKATFKYQNVDDDAE